MEVKTCLMNWCKIKYGKNTGWVNKLNLWGVYEKRKYKYSILPINYQSDLGNKLELFYRVAVAVVECVIYPTTKSNF